MTKRLEGKVAIITGGASGIGRATGLLFGRHGASVVVADLSQQSADNTADEIAATGAKATGMALDVTSAESVKTVVAQTLDLYGGIHILVNSAGLNPRMPAVADMDEEAVWDAVIDVNLKGTYLACRHAADAMVASGGGSIINLSSIMGLVGYTGRSGSGFSPYNPSKGGVLLLTKNLAVDLAPKGVRVNCINPGFVETPFTAALTSDPVQNAALVALHPIGRLAQPEEIANCALFLASDESSFVTGAPLIVDGGYTAQ
jgi:NAD(P)-dependent dehydrogenase (short-subunit alcohol dehydrogenase family)